MLEIRRITNVEEKIATNKIMTVVFNGRGDFTQEEKPDPLHGPLEWRWAAFDEGKMVSTMIENEYLMRFDGNSVKMSGIGGVGTLPEARKGGKIRDIFYKLFPEAYEKGVMFSNLTPFSHAFYRQFGYETCCSRNQISVPMSDFDGLKLRGTFTPFVAGDDTSVLQKIHSAYIANVNHAICRDYWPDDRAWKIFTKGDPHKDGTFLYVWRDEAGQARAYVKYQHENHDGKNDLAVQELMFTDIDALYGTLTLFGGMSAQYKNFRWTMPTFLDPTDFVRNTWSVEQKIVPRDMTRVVNVAEALTIMRRPAGEGGYVLEVDDPILPANRGRFLVEYGPEGTRVSQTKKDADLACDIPVLSQLITGYRALDNAMRTRISGLTVNGNLDTLNKVFTLRPQQITEAF